MIAFILQIGIAVPLGILAARKQYSKVDYGITVFALIGISLPSFFFATLLKYIFSIKLGWFDLYGVVGRMHEQLSPFGKVMDIAQHLVLPITTLLIVQIGSLMRYTRTNMLEVLNADYIRTARAKGLPESRVINHHAFRNTLDSNYHNSCKPAASSVFRSSDHRNTVPDSRYRLYFLSVSTKGIYSFYNVLHDIYRIPDINGNTAC